MFRPSTLLKRDKCFHRCFLMDIGKSLRKPILKIMWERVLVSFEVFCKDLINISYENATFGILGDSIWLQLIYFFTTIAFWVARCPFQIKEDNFSLLVKNLVCVLFITLISHYGKITAMHKLISILVQLTNQIK